MQFNIDGQNLNTEDLKNRRLAVQLIKKIQFIDGKVSYLREQLQNAELHKQDLVESLKLLIESENDDENDK